jgi:acyl-coenzyme A synthetase/AMP-(fatty) acid ligase
VARAGETKYPRRIAIVAELPKSETGKTGKILKSRRRE